ncbi:MAG: DUF362 domain-containing protein [Patescibacteria group bacterium]|nr:DUF362 domain-containing protein [Patescibacteria group bacterium]
MIKQKVFFYPIKDSNPNDISLKARHLLERVIDDSKIVLEKEIPVKVHPGQMGNITFIKPENFDGIIDYLLKKNITTYFVETGMVTGPGSNTDIHRRIAMEHGFTKVSFVIADGEDGKDHIEVEIKNGKFFKKCMIGRKLVEAKQVVVLSHFKGHVDAGFGGAIKMLGIGFASRQGKMEAHSKVYTPDLKTIDWRKHQQLYYGKIFRERVAEYALAAAYNKRHIYINFALSITDNCDCDNTVMTPIYNDLGIFASIDPVAVDKACFDLLKRREGKKPFEGEDVFTYAEKIGLGSQNYELINLFL